MIYNKAVVAAFLLAFATTSCEAEYTRHSRTVRGSSNEDETSRLLNPAGGKGGSKSSKSKKGFSFTNPKNSEEVCLLEQTTSLIEGSTTAIPLATNPLPAGFSFRDCNDLLSKDCSKAANIPLQLACLFPPAPAPLPTLNKDDYYKCLEKKGVIVGPWFLHRDTPGSQFRFTTAYGGGFNGSPGSACSKITYSRDETPGLRPKAELEFFSEDFFGTKLSDFVSFSVDYRVVGQSVPSTNQYFVNMYVRTDPSSTFFFDCNFVYIPDAAPGTSVWKTLKIDLDTPISDKRDRGRDRFGVALPKINPLCSTFSTLRQFLGTFNGAVIGVGNGDTETINLVTGETGSSYKGLEVCWDNAQVTTTTEKFVYDFEPAA